VSGSRFESALIVEVPEAESAVAPWRARLDENAARLGIPAHVTVLAPFMPPELAGPGVTGELARLLGGVPRFRFRLVRTAWFGEGVLWLAPDQPGRFSALTELVSGAFPAYPPFGGQFEEVIPHLTVGLGQPLADLRAAEEALQAALPIEAEATAVTLMTGSPSGGRWATTARFPLG
jgi:hypothetical protein